MLLQILTFHSPLHSSPAPPFQDFLAFLATNTEEIKSFISRLASDATNIEASF